MGKAFYNLDDIRSIPLLDICEMFGVDVQRQGKSYFCKLRDEKTASCKLYVGSPGETDSFYDFGSNVGGDVIRFVSEALGCDWQAALEEIASRFDIAPVNNTEYMTRSELTDLEYKKIGVHGDLATKNFDFDLEKYSMESAQKFSEKYAMSVNQLRKDYPAKYAYDVMKKRAIPFVYSLRNQYYFKLYCWLSLQKSLTGHFDINNVSNKDMQECKELCHKLEQAEMLLRKALRGTDIVYSYREYNLYQDLTKLHLGQLSFEVGDKSYSDLKRDARKQGVDLMYRSVPIEDYLSLKEYGIDIISHAAFLKNDDVNLVFLPEQSELIDQCIELYSIAKEEKRQFEQENKVSEPIKPIGPRDNRGVRDVER